MSTPPPELRFRPGVRLLPWQEEAVTAWRESRHPERGPRHGIIQAVTGTGKTIAALACMVDAAREVPDLRFAIVVPGKDLALQWQREVRERLNLPSSEVSLRMTGHDGSLRRSRVVIWVVNSARDHLAVDCRGLEVMLIIDECHRTGSAKNRRVYDATSRFRLGLSATAERQREVDANGVRLPLDQQVHARALGPSCYRLTVAAAEARGMLPPFQIVHHGISLSPAEDVKYARHTREVTDALAEASRLGVSAGQISAVIASKGGRWDASQRQAAQAAQAALLRRKHFLYLRPERNRVAATLLGFAFADAAAKGQDLQAILFNERIEPRKPADVADPDDADLDDEGEPEEGEADDSPPEQVAAIPEEGAQKLYQTLVDLHAAGGLAISGTSRRIIRVHHSKAPDPDAIPDMKRPIGDPARARILVTVKSVVEGIDLPNADVGVIVASSSSVLQRIQTLGRILRPRRGPGGGLLARDAYDVFPLKTLHVIYVKGTVDEEIYLQTDWEELLGKERNVWFHWSYRATSAAPDPLPPIPPMSESEAWAWVRGQLEAGLTFPLLWPSRLPDHQGLMFTGNAVRVTQAGPPVHNASQIEEMVERAALTLAVPSTSLRSRLAVTLSQRLLIRMAPSEVRDMPATDPRNGRPLRRPFLVLGQLDELPRLGADGDGPAVPSPRMDPTAPPPEPRRVAQRETSPKRRDTPEGSPRDQAAITVMRLFIQSFGAPNRSGAALLAADYPEAASVVREGVAGVSGVLPPENIRALFPGELLALYLRLRASSDTEAARRIASHLAERKAPLAVSLTQLVARLDG